MDRFLQSNTVMKVVAFIMALMLWMIVSLDEKPSTPIQEGERTLDNVNIDLSYDEGLYSIMETSPGSVKVKLTGNRVLINSIINYKVYADLKGLKEGKHTVPLKFDGFAAEIDVDIEPKTISVVLEKKEAKAFPIEVEVTGKPQQGYTIGEIDISPTTVHVIAPTTILDQIAKVKGFVSVDKGTSTFTENVNVKVYDQFGNEMKVEISPSEAKVKVPVKSPTTKVPLKLLFNKKLPEGLSIVSVESNINEVEISAPKDVLDHFSELEVPIDLSKITSSQIVQYPISLGNGWDGVEPQVVDVDIKVSATQQRNIPNIPIKVSGLKEGYEFEFMEPSSGRVDLLINGSRDQLNLLKVSEIESTIDVSNLTKGTHSVSLKTKLPKYLEIDKQDLKVSVEINPVDQAQETSTEDTENRGG